MRSSTLSVLLVSLILAVFPTFSQTPPPSQSLVRDPQAIAIAVHSLGSMGVISASLPVDSRVIATLTVNGQTPIDMNLVLESKGLTSTRAELQQSSGTSVRVVNGGVGAIRQPDGSVRKVLDNNTFAEHINYLPILSLLAEVQNPAAELEIVSRASSTNTADDVISVALGVSADPKQAAIERQLSRTDFYINAGTGLVDRIEFIRYSEHPRSTPLHIQEFYSDYRMVGGVAIPFHQITLVEGQHESDMQLSSISLNVGLSESEFTVPGSVQ